MDDTFIHSTAEEHMDDLIDLFKVLRKYGLESPKTLRQTRAFCGMVNFLSSFLPNLRRLLIPIYDLQKKAKKFK